MAEQETEPRRLIVRQTAGALLARNLRLLDLHLLSDWPDIHSRSFKWTAERYGKNKERIRQAEWVLFRLFELWNSELAELAFAEYYPPLVSLQSIKFRTRACAMLEELKKGGMLSQACPLRSSLFDHCTGPRFEEMLLAFSTMVLKARLEQRKQQMPEALRLAMFTDADSETDKQQQILSLSLQASLTSKLRARQQYDEYHRNLAAEFSVREEYYNLKEEFDRFALAQYSEQSKAAGLSQDDLKRKVRTNSKADPTWVNVAVSGDSDAERDGLAEADNFDEVWSRARKGLPPDTETPAQMSLTARLETVVLEQRGRLQQLRDFQSRVSQRNGDLIVSRSTTNSPRKTPRHLSMSSPRKNMRRNLSETPDMTPARPVNRRSFSPKKHTGSDAVPQSNLGRLDELPAAERQRHRLTYSFSEGAEQPRMPLPDNYSGIDGESRWLSLAQRTRNSMATVYVGPRMAPLPAGPLAWADNPESVEESSLETLTEQSADMSLTERIRLSREKLGSENSNREGSRQAEHRRSESRQLHRKSAFPVNPFEHRASNAANADADAIGHADKQESQSKHAELDAQTVQKDNHDEESIFQPRSKLRRSPPPNTSDTSMLS